MASPKVTGPKFAIVPDSVLYATVSPMAKLLWALYARHADPAGGCFPGVDHCSKTLGVSHDTVQRAKAELVKAELIECSRCYDDDGRRMNDHVTLCADYTLTRKSAWQPNTQKSATLPRKSACYINKEVTKPVQLKGQNAVCKRCNAPARLFSNGQNLCSSCYHQVAS